MFLRRIEVKGYRAAVGADLVCDFPGRFSVVVGANGTGKTTVAEAMYLSHRHVFPQITRPIAAALERGMTLGDVLWDTPTEIGIPFVVSKSQRSRSLCNA